MKTLPDTCNNCGDYRGKVFRTSPSCLFHKSPPPIRDVCIKSKKMYWTGRRDVPLSQTLQERKKPFFVFVMFFLVFLCSIVCCFVFFHLKRNARRYSRLGSCGVCFVFSLSDNIIIPSVYMRQVLRFQTTHPTANPTVSAQFNFWSDTDLVRVVSNMPKGNSDYQINFYVGWNERK